METPQIPIGADLLWYVRQIVGALHVSATESEVTAAVLSSLTSNKKKRTWYAKQGESRQLAIAQCAVEIHRANRALYVAVMTGSLS